MKIGIVGAGVLGSIFGSLFSKKGLEIHLIEVLDERIRVIKRKGLWVQMPDGERVHTKPHITKNPEEVGVCDVVMVCVKGYHTGSAAETAAPMVGDETLVVSVQNGLGNLEVLAERFGPDRVVGGITAHSGMPVGMNEVRYVGGLGPFLVIGPFDGVRRPPLIGFIQWLDDAGFDVHGVDDINPVIWKKLIANVATNCVAGLTGLTGGKAVTCEPVVGLIRSLADELAQVARARGIDFPELDAPGDFALQAFASTKDNRVSMLQDVEAGRPTEIGTLNEVIVSEGERLGVETPYNRAVSQLVRGVELKNRLKLEALKEERK